MSDQVLLDNDVTLKVVCYSLVPDLVALGTSNGLPPAILGVARFVIGKRLTRASNVADAARATTEFEQLLQTAVLIEPDDEELGLAADLEAEASRLSLELDGGESQLLAILARRACRLLMTGDKRAIVAMAVVAPALSANRIVCLEQVMVRLVDVAGLEVVRLHVCREPAVDRAITSCFACSTEAVERADVLEGLRSYISHLDRAAPGVLMHSFDGAATEP